MELAVHWSPINVQRVMALVDTDAECSLVHGKPEQFPGHRAYMDGYDGQSTEVKAVSLALEIGRLSMPCTLCTCPQFWNIFRG